MSAQPFQITCLVLLTATFCPAQPRLRLKTWDSQRMEGEHQAGPLKRRPFSRPHILVQFRNLPQEAEVLELKNRGLEVLEYLPDTGLLATAPENASLDDLDLVEARQLRPEEKISPLIRRATVEHAGGLPRPRAFIVEFHQDVLASEAFALAREAGFEPRYHPDLLAHDLLIEGPAERAMALAEWDEVAYIYPAAEELQNGTRVHACAGPLTQYGRVGQLVAQVGDGWDGPGQGAAVLGYYLGALASRLPRLAAQTEVLRGLSEWSKYVQVDFQPAASPSASRTVSILFGAHAHGDPFPFDGPGGVLAHTFYPVPLNPESIAGDMHLDDDENWGIGQNVDLFSVALHEAGHALGLGHSDQPGTVMYPYYRQVTGLSEDDVAAIRSLYAARGGSVTPSTPPPTDPQPPPTNPQPPTTPTPPTTPKPPAKPKPPATPKPPAGGDTTPPALTILAPGSSSVLTYSTTIALRGSASDNIGVVKVTWQDTLGNGGVAAGTAAWQVTVPLRLGTNTITVRAFDAAGNSSWRSLSITRKNRK